MTELPLERPMTNSKIIRGRPKKRMEIRYGIRNAPPPLAPTIYGNRHIFPMPTADPILARMKPATDDHCSLSIPFTIRGPFPVVGLYSFFICIPGRIRRQVLYGYRSVHFCSGGAHTVVVTGNKMSVSSSVNSRKEEER